MKRQHHGMQVNTESKWPMEDLLEKIAIQPRSGDWPEAGLRSRSLDRDKPGLALERYHAVVADMAYRLWELRGRTHGADVEDWLDAEAELRSPGPAERTPASQEFASSNSGKL